MVQLSVQDCYDNNWKLIKGAYFGCYNTSSGEDATIALTFNPTSSCPGSNEKHKIDVGESYTFDAGYKVKVTSASRYYAEIDVSLVSASAAASSATSSIVSDITSKLKIYLPMPDGSYAQVGSYDIDIPSDLISDAVGDVSDSVSDAVSSVVSKVSKTMTISNLPSASFLGDEVTIVGLLDADGVPIANEPVVLKVDSVKIGETTTDSVGIFTFTYSPESAGSHKIVLSSPATSAYPDSGTISKYMAVSSIASDVAEQVASEQAAYEARRELLSSGLIELPDEYGYESIISRVTGATSSTPSGTDIVDDVTDVIDDVVDNVPDASDVTDTVEDAVGSISVELPSSSLLSGLISVPVKVFLDGANVGTAPITLSDISVGSHIIKLTATGFGNVSIPVNVTENGTATISGISLTPL